jgi:hypothetical protein
VDAWDDLGRLADAVMAGATVPPLARASTHQRAPTRTAPPCEHLGPKRPGQPAVCQWTCLFDCELLTDAAGDPLACRPSERFGWDGDGPRCPGYAVKVG